MYDFVRRPKWIASHIFVVALVVIMVFLGLWQVDRLQQRRSTNNEVTDRLEQSVEPVSGLVTIDDSLSIGEETRFRLVTATGEYVMADEVLVRNRSLDGAPGYWVLTPLLLDSGDGVVVNRGWVPFSFEPGDARPGTEPPPGTVTVVGMVRETVEASGIQRSDRSGVELDSLARPDLARYQEQLDYDILPVLVQLESQQPAGNDLPVPLSRPELDEGPHLAYAVQWFIFCVIALIGYPLVIRRIAKSDGGDGRHSDIPVDYL
ncbi:MAG: SURF1 family cytochrome oxidase biogenesis protein [Acidimicrobiales bacterium]